MFKLFIVALVALCAALASATKDVRVGGVPSAELKAQFRQKAMMKAAKNGHNLQGRKDIQSTIVGAQLRCQGYLCPQWALDVSRWDLEPLCDECSQETNLVELLPLAPTFQRKPRIFTDYDPSSHVYTVTVQSYPGPGVDTYFTVSIADDISSAKILQNNVIVGHPDASVNNPGSMKLIRAFDSPDPNGGIVSIFDDGSVWNLDLLSKQYTRIGSIKSDSSVKDCVVTNAQVFDGNVLKSFLVQEDELKSYLVTLDITTGVATAPVALLPVQGGGSDTELPVNAHIIDNGLGTNILAVIMAGQFDQIIQVDEKVGTQTPIIFSITQDNEDYPSVLYCDTNTKDCDTVWTTSAYDASTKQLYMQTHYIDDQDVYWTSIYKQYYYQQQTGTWPYFDPATLMNFGYSGYQFVTAAPGSKLSIPKRVSEDSEKAKEERHKAMVKARKEMQLIKSTKAEADAHFADVKGDLKRALQSKNPTGTIISAQYWKDSHTATHELRISATYPIGQFNVPNDVSLQTLVPAITDDNQVFTAFDEDARHFYTVVDNFPRSNVMTLWRSAISGKADAATPIDVAVEMQYPDSGSPAPLNVFTPTIARLHFISGVGPTIVFSNGETYAIDLDTKQWKPKLFTLISQEDLYDVSHPYVTTSQTVDPATNTLHAFIFSASNVFLVNTDLKTMTVGSKIGPLDMPGTQDLTTGFSPETLLSAHMIPLEDGSGGLLMSMESLDNVGFDELNFVNTTSGALLGPMYNLMEDNILLSCPSYNCDKWRNSAYDPVSQVLYFQGHYVVPGSPAQSVLVAMVYVTNHVTGKKYWIINPNVESLNYGYTGFQWVPFVN